MTTYTPLNPTPGVYGKFYPEYSRTKTYNLDNRLSMYKVLTGHWVGLMPLEEMFGKFFAGVEIPDVACPDYSSVLEAKKESAMYKPWVQSTLTGDVPNTMSITISSERNSETSTLRPDTAIQFFAVPTLQSHTKDALAGPFQFTTVDIACEFKFSDLPFLYRRNPDIVETIETKEGGPARGQLALYAETHFEQQHRVCLWHIILNKQQAHIIRWDRSGAVVSEGFDPTTEPWILRLVWAYSRASRTQKGFDDTATLVGEDERMAFAVALAQYKTACDALKHKVFSGIHIRTDSSWPVYRLDVPDERAAHGVRPCLVIRPFYAAYCPVGRGTRVYVAYDVVEGKLRILKDAWRPEYPGCLPEHVAYSRLSKAGVEHVPKLVCGGDVRNSPTDAPQTTVAQDLAVGGESATWRLPCAPKSKFRKFVHYRILEDIAMPLEQLDSSRQWLIVIRDVLKAIQQAYTSAGLLHCDITWANIRWAYNYVSGRIEGVLIDWDHAEEIGQPKDEDTPNTSTTWHFMSLPLIDNPGKIRELIDNLESLFWTLLYGALRFVAHDMPFLLVGDGDFFSASVETIESRDGFSVKAASANKRQYLEQRKLELVNYRCIPFRDFIHDLTRAWRRFHWYLAADAADKVDQATFDQLRAELSDPQWLISKIDAALLWRGWEDKDIVCDQFEKISATDVLTLHDAVRASNLDASHMTGATETQIVQMPGRGFREYSTQRLYALLASGKRTFSATEADAPRDPAIYPVPPTTDIDPDTEVDARPLKIAHLSPPSGLRRSASDFENKDARSALAVRELADAAQSFRKKPKRKAKTGPTPQSHSKHLHATTAQ